MTADRTFDKSAVFCFVYLTNVVLLKRNRIGIKGMMKCIIIHVFNHVIRKLFSEMKSFKPTDDIENADNGLFIRCFIGKQ